MLFGFTLLSDVFEMCVIFTLSIFGHALLVTLHLDWLMVILKAWIEKSQSSNNWRKALKIAGYEKNRKSTVFDRCFGFISSYVKWYFWMGMEVSKSTVTFLKKMKV